jgi:hypothetical protein
MLHLRKQQTDFQLQIVKIHGASSFARNDSGVIVRCFVDFVHDLGGLP